MFLFENGPAVVIFTNLMLLIFDARSLTVSLTLNVDFIRLHFFFQILVELVNLFDWKVFTVLYEKNENLPKLSELVKMHDGKAHIISMKQLDQSNEKNYR